MLERNMFVVKEKAKLFSSRESYDIIDIDGKVIGTAEQQTGTLAKLLGSFLGEPPTRIEFREKPDDSLVFTVSRNGYVFKKVQVSDAQGTVLGTYKSKRFSLSGGFHVYDKAGKHVAEIRGKMLKAEYTFFAPDGKTEMGKVAKKWGGAMRELFTSADTYGVQIAPAFAEEPTTKMLILGAAVAIDCLFGGKGAKGGKAAAAGAGAAAAAESESED
jgi:uncharacterized protein YxjI